MPGWSPTTSSPPAAYDYGTLSLGATPSVTFTLANSGGSASGALAVALDNMTGTAFSIPAGGDHCSGRSLGPNKSCTVTVQFAPTATGVVTASLKATGAKPAGTATDALSGTGAQTVPGAPTGVKATATNAGATVSWTPPDNGGSAIVGDFVTIFSGSTQVGFRTSRGCCVTGAAVTGLTNGTTYTFTVSAFNVLGAGPSQPPPTRSPPPSHSSASFVQQVRAPGSDATAGRERPLLRETDTWC